MCNNFKQALSVFLIDFVVGVVVVVWDIHILYCIGKPIDLCTVCFHMGVFYTTIAAAESLCLAPVLAIHGRFQAAEGYVSRAVECLSNLGLDCEGVTKIVPPLIAALCGKTADAQKLVQQFLVSKDLQWRKVHRKFITWQT